MFFNETITKMYILFYITTGKIYVAVGWHFFDFLRILSENEEKSLKSWKIVVKSY